MNRLLRIDFDTFLTSVTPILGWFLLGILVDKNLINIFSLIYPIQFVISAIQSVFGTGANISSIRDKNKNSVFSGVVLGSGIGLIILGCIAINIDKYITFMNMDIDTYKIFGVYAVIQMFFQLLLNLSLCKLYFEEENKRANKYSLLFNYNSACTLINDDMIVDMPNGTLKQLLKKNYNPDKIKTILITHMHGDHTADVPFFLKYVYNFSKINNEIVIIGPKGIENEIIKDINGYKVQSILVSHGEENHLMDIYGSIIKR